MNMKIARKLIVSLMFLLGTHASAASFAFLSVEQEGEASSFEVSQISKITFDESDMVLHLSNGNEQRLPLNTLQKMFFSEQGIEAVGTVVADEEKIRISDGQLRLQLGDNEKAVIYNMKGELVYVTNRSGSFQIDNLRKGVYIVRVGNTTKKVMTK